jgi:SPOR domain
MRSTRSRHDGRRQPFSARCDVFATIRKPIAAIVELQLLRTRSGRRMFPKSASIVAPGVGFVLGLVVTYGLADAGPGPVSSHILKDALVSQTSVGLRVRVGDDGLASFDERFAGSKVKKEGLASYPHLASLEVGLDAGVLVDRPSVSAPSSGILLAESSDSFAERFAGTKVVNPAPAARSPESSWVVQLIGDDTEETALSRFRQMQNKHKAILGIYKPLVVNTTLTLGAPSIWTRVRVGLTSREAAESLCAKLELAGERCVVQRNADANNPKQQVKLIEDTVERAADSKAVSKRAG